MSGSASFLLLYIPEAATAKLSGNLLPEQAGFESQDGLRLFQFRIAVNLF